jgi:hypothetical protein
MTACGAPRETRTPDPLITNQMLYQLSYRGHAPQIQAQGRPRKGSVPLVARQKHDGQKPDRHHQQGGGGGFGQPLKTCKLEHPR